MTRVDLLNYLIERFGYTRYLEIGVADESTCFSSVRCRDKTGVDPERGGTYRMTSDDFFGQATDTWDLIFIDGLHECCQVHRDITHAVERLAPNGSIVVHDCNPEREEEAEYPPSARLSRGVWNGDVWKALAYWRTRLDMDVACGDFDWGCGVIRSRPNTDLWPIGSSWQHDFRCLTWADFVAHRRQLLRLMTFDKLKEWL
jgi:hypothetical protein